MNKSVKQLILILVMIFGISGCIHIVHKPEGEEDVELEKHITEHVGNIAVRALNSGEIRFVDQRVKTTLALNADSSAVTLTLWGIRMHDTANTPLNIAIEDMEFDKMGDTCVIASSEVVPTVGGTPAVKYTLTDLSVEFTDSDLHVQFTHGEAKFEFYTELEYSYNGRFTVSEKGEIKYKNESAKFTITQCRSTQRLTLMMHRVKFATMMPVTLNIEASDLDYVEDEDTIVIQTASVIPTVGDVPMEKYVLKGLDIRIKDEKLEVGFECKGMEVEYGGKGR